MGIFRRKSPTIADLKNQASGTMRQALVVLESLVDEIQDGVTLVLVKQPGVVLWKSALEFFTSEQEVEFPVGLRILPREEED